ncbi:MAG: (deoxy)nucleoside triphosphate pyrophosphohydrolase [Gemmatimonadaceae bacterium]|jgi:mutator protein MutT|nr:(deoxy)nucleoside triphosphate pyrophosphohydrolase [Gemmatimonadaceae bacterium]
MSPNAPTRVLAAVLERDGRLLVARRPAHKRHGGLWEFPGGKVEPGESDAQALARELHEELGLTAVRLGAVRFERRDEDSPFLIVFREASAAGDPAPLEHEALAWATPAELAAYPLAPSDAAFVQHLLSAP